MVWEPTLEVVSASLIARTRTRWTYGVVTGYRWSKEPSHQLLFVSSPAGNFDFKFDLDYIQDLAAETYAMRLCDGKSVLVMMPAEMRALHDAAYNAFLARGRSAVRIVADVCTKIGAEPVSELGNVFLLDIASMEVSTVSAKYVLDYVFYHNGNRRVPSTVILGESIFDEPGDAAQERVVSGAGDTTAAMDPLQDSDDDSEPESGPSSTVAPARASSIRPRGPDLMDFSVRAQARKLNGELSSSAATRLQDGLEMLIGGETGNKGQFRASRLQNTVHQAIVNGTYSDMGVQLFVEHLQAQMDLSAFLPHPAVLKGFYAWEIGTRGLSILHFGRVDTRSRRQRLAGYNTCDFSNSNSLPRPEAAEGMDMMLAYLDVLALLVEEVYQPFVGRVLTAARRFFLRQKLDFCTVDPDTLADLVFWIDERLEKIRTYIVLGSTNQCTSIQLEFSVSHESYVRVQNVIRDRQYTSLKNRQLPTSVQQYKSDGHDRSHNDTNNKRVPDQVLSALPTENRKKLCMRSLSNQGCRGRGARCTDNSPGHFRPRQLPVVMKDFIEAKYGGLKPEFLDL